MVPVASSSEVAPPVAALDARLESPAPRSASDSRATERYRLALWGTLTGVATRGLGMVLLLLGVRFTIDYLGTERFGLWATFSGMVAMLSLLDLGIGNALVNRVAQAAAKSESESLQRVISGGIGLLMLLGIASAALLSMLAWVLPWQTLFKLSNSAVTYEAQLTATVFALFFGLNMTTSGALRILSGQQRSFEANLFSAAATAVACVSLALAAQARLGVPWLLAATFGVQTLGGLGAGLLLLKRGQLVLSNVRAAMRLERSHLLGTGALFLLLQVGTMLGWGSDSVLLALLRGSGEVAVYAVAVRLFQFASQPFAMINAPLWASYADANSRHDKSFIRVTLKRSFCVSFLGSAAISAALCVFGHHFVGLWTKGTLSVPFSVLVLIAIWTVFEAGGNAFGVYLNGCGIVREQVVVVLLFCALVLPLKLWLGSRFGIDGLFCAAISAYGVVIVGLYGFVFKDRVFAPLGKPA